MPTYSFARTREQLRDLVVRKLSVLGAGETVSAEDAAIVYEAIDLRLKELHGRNLLWFKVAGALSDVALTAGVATASAAGDVLYPVSFAVRVNGEDVPVQIVDHRTFEAIPNKTDTGQPEMVLFSGGTYRFWPVPDMAYTGKFSYQQAAVDTVAATAVDMQTAMLRSLRVLVAYDLADDFGLGEQKIMRLKLEADDAMKMILALNAQRTDAVQITPEYF
jgi:hypothetical protein